MKIHPSKKDADLSVSLFKTKVQSQCINFTWEMKWSQLYSEDNDLDGSESPWATFLIPLNLNLLLCKGKTMVVHTGMVMRGITSLVPGTAADNHYMLVHLYWSSSSEENTPPIPPFGLY